MRRRLACVWSICVLLAAAANVHAADDIVAYASDVTAMQGNWTRAASSSGAGGQLMTGSDYGWSATSAALESPNDYFEVPVSASANTPYHVWVRMRASGDSKWNDSVWLQFSDAVASNGSGLYRIGSTSGLLLNLESCSGCGTSGWGWVDGAYWLGQTAIVQFPSTGTHTIRVQSREDGAQIDQIVLSPATWMQSAPGQNSNDSTIIAKSSTGGAGAPAGGISGGGASPYSGTVALPGTVQAEEFDEGGEGVGYYDTTGGNSGGVMRSTDVDVEYSSGGGYNVGWIAPGEWLQYSVNVTSAGSYTFAVRVAASGQGGSFHLEMNGANVTGSITIPDTGGWQSWQTLTRTVSLSAGAQQARLVIESNGANAVGNIDWWRVSPSGGGSAPGGSASPYTGSPAAIPGTVEAEQFDNGGEGVAYHDLTGGNSGGVFRSTDVDVESVSGGGYDVGWVVAGEWLQYTGQRRERRILHRAVQGRVARRGRRLPPRDEWGERNRSTECAGHRRVAELADCECHGAARRRPAGGPTRHRQRRRNCGGQLRSHPVLHWKHCAHAATAIDGGRVDDQRGTRSGSAGRDLQRQTRRYDPAHSWRGLRGRADPAGEGRERLHHHPVCGARFGAPG